MLRSAIAVVLGVLLGGLAIGLVEAVGHQVFPLPAGLDPADPSALAEVMAERPSGALLFVLAAWAIGSVVAGWLAAKVAARVPLTHSMVAGGLLLLAGIVNLVMIPHPVWFVVTALLVFLPCGYLGGLIGGGRRAL